MSLLIRNAQVLNGKGTDFVRHDVLVKNQRIHSLGYFPQKSADVIIDAQGQYLIPGIIDSVSHLDHRFSHLGTSTSRSTLEHGMTTAIIGHDGHSLAPSLQGKTHRVDVFDRARDANIDWGSFADFQSALLRSSLPVHLLSFVGYETLLRNLVSDLSRTVSIATQEKVLCLFERALKEGAWGLSAGVEFARGPALGKMLPRWAALFHEYKAIYAPSFDAVGFRPFAELEKHFSYASRLSFRIFATHTDTFLQDPVDLEKYLQLFERLAKNSSFRFSLSPSLQQSTLAENLLPLSAREGRREDVLQRIKDSYVRKKIAMELTLPQDPSRIIFIDTPYIPFGAGKSLAQFSEELSRGSSSPEEVFLEILSHTRGRARVLIEKSHDLLQLMEHPLALLATYDHGNPESHIGETLRLNPPLIEYLVLQYKKSLSQFARTCAKLTLAPAEFFRLLDRGRVRPGFVADLVLLQEGIPTLAVVNGALSWRRETDVLSFNGKPITHHT